MKTYWQFILELTAYQRMEKASWAKAAKRKTAAPKPTAKTALPWGQRNDAVGWYHPKKKSFLFAWGNRDYHITQIVKRPEMFDITTADIVKALKKFGKSFCKNSKDPSKCAENLLIGQFEKLVAGEIDQLSEVTDLVLDKGWAMVTIMQGEIMIKANQTDTHKAAVREILEADAMQGKIVRIRNERTPSKDLELFFVESAEKFLHS
jgi:hypothetical protein